MFRPWILKTLTFALRFLLQILFILLSYQNWNEMEYAIVQLFVFLVFCGTDAGFAIYRHVHDMHDQVGYVAHLCGAVAGILSLSFHMLCCNVILFSLTCINNVLFAFRSVGGNRSPAKFKSTSMGTQIVVVCSHTILFTYDNRHIHSSFLQRSFPESTMVQRPIRVNKFNVYKSISLFPFSSV